jgi:L-ascorbate metabolism protein UlaG (beta-lactamase superfamily)
MKIEEIKKILTSSLGENEVAFLFLGYSGVIIKTSKGTIIIDPADLLKGKELETLKAGGLNLLLFTHSHGDHYNYKDALALFKATNASVIAEPSVYHSLQGEIPLNKLIIALPGITYTVDEITINAIKGAHVGPISLYQIQIGGISIFHGGDSDYVPIKDYPSDLAFLPTGDPSPTASPQGAFNMASDLNPSVIVAMHGSMGQSKEFERKIKENMPHTVVIIPEPYRSKIVTLRKRT